MDYLNEYKKIFNGECFIREGKKITHNEYAAFDGGGVRTLIDNILKELAERNSITILDWGCGTSIHWHKQCLVNRTKSLMNILGDKVQSFYRYDPCLEKYSKKPSTKYDFIVCADVLEHIPDTELESFFNEINSYLEDDGIIFYSISTIPSKNCFLDGSNMHVTIKNVDEWKKVLKLYSKSKISVVFNGKYYY